MAPGFLIPLKEASAQGPNLNTLRSYYIGAVHDPDSAAQFYKITKNYKAIDPLITGFAGASKTLMAKHSWNPYNKMDYLKSGMNQINKAIEQDSQDVELRFLRFSIENALPGFLGYNQHLEKDRKAIQAYFLNRKANEKPEKVEQVILEFLLETGECPPEVQNKLVQKLK